MDPISITFIISAFIAGVLMFLAPCTLPLVPAYLGFISGVSSQELKDPHTAARARRTIFINGVAFILGFSFVFIVFGTLVGFLGQELATFRTWFARIGGVLIMVFGLFMLGAFKLPALSKEKRLRITQWIPIGNPTSSFAIGATFALGWTPCIGPILGSILLLAATSATALQGALLLTVFSAGLAIPFIVLALAFAQATQYIEQISVYLKWVSVVGGVFLILLGFLLVTDNFGLTIQKGYEWFDFLHYKALLDYL